MWPKVRLGRSTIAIIMDLYSHLKQHLQDEVAGKLDETLCKVIQSR